MVTTRFVALLTVTLSVATSSSTPTALAAAAFPIGELIDLSHTYDAKTIYWATADGFRLDTPIRAVAVLPNR